MAIVDLVVVALFAVIVALIVQGRRSGDTPDKAAAVSDEARRLRDDMTELRARIQVLERVVTDTHGSADLSSEIERLRDR